MCSKFTNFLISHSLGDIGKISSADIQLVGTRIAIQVGKVSFPRILGPINLTMVQETLGLECNSTALELDHTCLGTSAKVFKSHRAGQYLYDMQKSLQLRIFFNSWSYLTFFISSSPLFPPLYCFIFVSSTISYFQVYCKMIFLAHHKYIYLIS